MKKIIKKILPKNLLECGINNMPAFMSKTTSYSQCGEDLILTHVYKALKINDSINYCDIGANSPWKFSNTAKFYLQNKNKYIGVLVEPDPSLFKILDRKRRKDTIINCGIKSGNINESCLDFYIMSSHTLNTFSEEEAKYYESLGYTIKDKKQINVIDINTLLSKYFTNRIIHLLSIDVEGLDYDILKSLDFEIFKPICICIETINFVPDGMAEKDYRIEELLVSKGYFEYAFTGINSIFVDKNRWANR